MVKYDVDTEIETIVYQYSGAAEFWKMVTINFVNFYILGNKTVGSNTHRNADYDSSFSGAERVYIWHWDGTNLSELLTPNATLRPQLARFMRLGSDSNLELGSEPRLPDSNAPMFIHNNHLYYRYADALRGGVAKLNLSDNSVVSLWQIDNDRRFNLASFTFTIDGTAGIGIGAVRVLRANNSELQVFSFNL